MQVDVEKYLKGISPDFYEDDVDDESQQKFNPFNHWTSSQENQQYFQSLETWKEKVDLGVKKVVEAQYKGFNTSTTSFANILSSFTESQDSIEALNENIKECRRLISPKMQKKLRELWFESVMYRKVQEILNKVEYITTVPEKLEAYVKKRQYLHAVNLLQDTLSTLTSKDLEGIGALQELLKELRLKKNDLESVLIEELHSLVYLKSQKLRSMRCEAQIRTHSSERDFSLAALLFAEEEEQYLSHPEGDFERYIHMIVESLKSLERSVTAKNELYRRLHSELKTIINDEMAICKKKAVMCGRQIVVTRSVRKGAYRTRSTSTSALTQTDLLIDLLQRIFAVFIQILKNHLMVVYLFEESQKTAFSFSEISSFQRTPNPRHESDTYAGSRLDNPNPMAWRGMKSAKYALARTYYSEQSVWESMQIELRDFLCEFLQAQSTILEPAIVHALPIKDIELAEDSTSVAKLFLNFSFDGSKAASKTLASRVGTQEEKQEDKQRAELDQELASIRRSTWVEPSPYHITSMYGAVVAFTEQTENLLQGARLSSQNLGLLRSFMNDFITSAFLPRVREDSLCRVKQIFEQENPFKVEEIHDNKFSQEAVYLLRCAVDIYTLVQNLFEDFYTLNYDAGEFSSILDNALGMFLNQSRKKYDNITAGLFSAAQSTSPSVTYILRNDLLYKTLINTSSNPNSSYSDEQYYHDELKMFSSRISHSSLCFEQSVLVTLALISESVAWLHQEIVKLSNPPMNSPGKSPRRIDKSLNYEGTQRGPERVELSGRMVNGFKELSDRCLFTLRVEFHAHCVFFLQDMETGDYWINSQSERPEVFVLSLNKDLLATEEFLKPYLSSQKLMYMFGHVPRFVSALLINGLRNLKKKRFNANGVLKMCRNISALQQNITNVVVSDDTFFDNARKYYELLLLSDDELLAYDDDSERQIFSASHLKAIREIETPLRSRKDTT